MMSIHTRFKLPVLVTLLAGMFLLAGCAGQQTIAVFVTPTPAVAATAPAASTPLRAAVQPTLDPAFTPLPTPLPPPPGVQFGPIIGPQYTPEPRYTPLPPTVAVRPCRALVTAPELAVYASPDRAAPVVRQAAQGEQLVVSQLAADSAGAQWAQVADGWVPLSAEGVTTAQLADLRACAIAAGSQPDTMLFGLHILNDFTSDAVLAFVERMAASGHPVGTLKGLNGTERLLTEAKRISPQTVIVFRSLVNPDGFGDCPGDIREMPDPAATARRWLDGLAPYWDKVDADYYEVLNECPVGQGWLAQFSVEAMKIANEQGRCLLLFSFGVGSPDMQTFSDLLPAYAYAAEHPCQPGRTHGIALHAYSMEDDVLLSEADVWLTQRHRILHERLLQELPAAADLPVYITEAGTGWGSVMPECDVVARDVVQYTYQLEETPYVKGFHLWNVGPGPMWPDLSPCLPAIGDALLNYYTHR
jgi:hypothetical protein